MSGDLEQAIALRRDTCAGRQRIARNRPRSGSLVRTQRNYTVSFSRQRVASCTPGGVPRQRTEGRGDGCTAQGGRLARHCVEDGRSAGDGGRRRRRFGEDEDDCAADGPPASLTGDAARTGRTTARADRSDGRRSSAELREPRAATASARSSAADRSAAERGRRAGRRRARPSGRERAAVERADGPAGATPAAELPDRGAERAPACATLGRPRPRDRLDRVSYPTQDNLALAPQVQLRERAVVSDDDEPPVPDHHAAPDHLQRGADDRRALPGRLPGDHEPHRNGRGRTRSGWWTSPPGWPSACGVAWSG